MQNQSDTFDIGGDLTVHRLGFGAMRLTGENIIGRPDDEAEARDVLRRAVELGVDFIDTADSYGPGVSERLIGQVLGDDRPLDADGAPDGKRDEGKTDEGKTDDRTMNDGTINADEVALGDDVVVATKAGLLRNRDGDWLAHGDPDYIRNQVLCSLDRLRTDRIDLYQFHRPDPDTPFEESVQAFAELKDEGVVEHVGLSNVSVEQLEAARDVVEVATVQNHYNVVKRDAESVLAACEEYGIGFIPWFPLGGGEFGDREAALSEIAAAHDATPRQVALAWLLQKSPVMLPIPGTSSVEHLEENVAAASVELSEAEMSRLAE